MTWLSEKPDDNQYVAATGLLAPVSFLGHAEALYQLIGKAEPALEVC